jgi:hypothetical protein
MGNESRIQFADTNAYEMTPSDLGYGLKTGSCKLPTSLTTEIVFYRYCRNILKKTTSN